MVVCLLFHSKENLYKAFADRVFHHRLESCALSRDPGPSTKKAAVVCQKVTLPVSVGGGATKRGDDAVVSVSGVAVTTAESLSS